MIARWIKTGWAALAGREPFRAIGCGGALVFCYHGVVEQVVDAEIQINHLPSADFRRQIDWLRREFDVVSLATLVDLLAGGKRLPGRMAAITFDDGYRNNLYIAAPLLHERSLPFAVFLSTGHIDEGRRFPTYEIRSALGHTRRIEVRLADPELRLPLRTQDERRIAMRAISGRIKYGPRDRLERDLAALEKLLAPGQREEIDARYTSDAPLNWSEARLLRNYGAVLGAHGHDHVLLHAAQTDDECRRQIERSRARLLAETSAADFFAYPNGGPEDFSPSAARAVAAAGFRAAFSTLATEARPGDPLFALPRIVAERWVATRFVARSSRFRRSKLTRFAARAFGT